MEYVSQEYYGDCTLNRNHRLAEASGLLLLFTIGNGVEESQKHCDMSGNCKR